jgi:hypothetical protein
VRRIDRLPAFQLFCFRNQSGENNHPALALAATVILTQMNADKQVVSELFLLALCEFHAKNERFQGAEKAMVSLGPSLIRAYQHLSMLELPSG